MSKTPGKREEVAAAFTRKLREGVNDAILKVWPVEGDNVDQAEQTPEFRDKLGQMCEHVVANASESLVAIAYELLHIPMNLRRIRAHLDSDGVQFKGTNIIAKISTMRDEKTLLDLNAMVGGQVEIINVQSEMDLSNNAGKCNAVAQTEIPLDDVTTPELFWVVEAETGKYLHEDSPLPRGEAENLMSLIVRDVYHGDKSKVVLELDSGYSDDIEIEDVEITAEEIIALISDEDGDAYETSERLMRFYDQLKPLEHFEPELSKWVVIYNSQKGIGLQALAPLLSASPDDCAWICAAAVSVCNWYFANEVKDGDMFDRVMYAVENYKPLEVQPKKKRGRAA